jgi:16S rRNA (cytidine1402-2'-O)-methyltransferase
VESALYVVATPIGNLADISARAVEVLGAVDLVAAEDTRHTQQLLAHHGIRRPLQAYHDHSGPAAAERILACLAEGGSVALVSDAGTPLLADPGYRLVRAVQDAGHRVVPIPGASAMLAALSAAGLPSDRFAFEGFLPARGDARRRRLGELAQAPHTLVFFEAPHRLLDTLNDLVDVIGPEREAALARELTKRFETLRRGPLGELRDWVAQDADQQRGEIVLLLDRAPDTAQELEPALLELLVAMAGHMPPKQAAALVAAYSGLRKNELYAALLEARGAD